MLAGDMEKAVPLLEKMLEMTPTIEVHQTLAEYYGYQNNPEKTRLPSGKKRRCC